MQMQLSRLQPSQVRAILQNLHKLPQAEQQETLELLEELTRRRKASASTESLLDFAKFVAPVLQIETEPKVFMVGQHHKRLASLMEAMARGEKKRVLISIAPRFGKSLLSSYLFPAWYLGKYPNRNVIMASHTADLAAAFGRKIRDLIATPEYNSVFSDVALKADSKAAGQWATNKGGQFYAVGVGGALAGRGAELLIIDDPFSEQDVVSGNTDVFDDVWTWFQSGPLQRLSPSGAVIVIHTRWSKADLIGKLVNQMTKNPDVDQWEVVEFPAILGDDTPNAKSLWPERWPLSNLLQKKAGMAPYLWSAQYMQDPTSEGAQILKAEWWRNWEKDDPPDCVYTVMSLDAAQESHNRADYSAVTLWGVFYVDGADGRKMTNVILLNAWRDRLEFPDLKRAVLADYKKWKPDTFIVEKKSNGAALYQELRRMDVVVTEFTPSKGQDKIARTNAVSDMFSSGMIWAPLDRRWAQEVVQECAEFPLGVNDDLHDSTTQAMLRIRQGGFLTLPSDYEDNELPEFKRQSRSYY